MGSERVLQQHKLRRQTCISHLVRATAVQIESGRQASDAGLIWAEQLAGAGRGGACVGRGGGR